MRIIDLTQPILSGMPVYPGDPAVRIEPALTIAADGVAVARLDLGSHTGTHIDAPAHLIAGGRTVDEIPLDLLMGPAAVLHCAAGPRSTIGIAAATADGERQLDERLPEIVCLSTGWDRHFGTPLMTEHPAVSLDLARELWERGARVLGVDTLSPDLTEGSGAAMPVHEFWLGRDGVIVENLRGLTTLPRRVQISLLPLGLRGIDGSPVRAVAWGTETPGRDLTG